MKNYSDQQHSRGGIAFRRFRAELVRTSDLAKFSVERFDDLPIEVQDAWIEAAEAIVATTKTP